MQTLLIFTGGETLPEQLIDDLPRPDLTIAADSGYDSAMALGYRVDVLVGDLDSIVATEIPDHVITERHPRDKDSTDLELALELAIREKPSRIVIVGGSGGRLDHELAITETLCSPRWADVDEIDWISRRAHAHIVGDRRILHGDIGSTISLFAIGGDATGVTTTGLKWNLIDEVLHRGSSRGVSNVMTSPVTDIRIESGCLLAVFPRTE